MRTIRYTVLKTDVTRMVLCKNLIKRGYSLLNSVPLLPG